MKLDIRFVFKYLFKSSFLLIAGIVFFGFITSPLQSGETENPNYRSFDTAKDLQAYMKWRPNKKPLISAHRGGPMKGFPENALETFENSLRYGPVLIECDVRQSKDQHLVMMHDVTLERTSTGKGKIYDHTLKELKELYLKDNDNNITPFRIPTFAEVLEWAKGRAILTLDVKRGVPFKRIVETVRLHKAEGHVIIITYTHRHLQEVYQLAPDLMISGPAKGLAGTKRFLELGVPADNICAFVGTYEPPPDVYNRLHEKGISTILGTMHNLDNKAAARGNKVYIDLYRNGADVLSTDRLTAVSEAVAEMNRNK